MTVVQHDIQPDARAEVRSSARSGAVSLLGAAVNGGCGFVLTTVIVRSYGAAGSGAVFAAIGLVSIVAAVSCLGADTGLVWSLPRRRPGPTGDGARLLPVALIPPVLLALLVAAGGVAAAGLLDPLLFDPARQEQGRALLRLAFLGIPVAVAMTVLLAAVRGVRSIGGYVAVQNFLVPISRPVLIGAAVLTGGGVVAGFGGWLLPYGLAALVAAVLVGRPLGVLAGARLRPERRDWRTFWGFALPRAASAAIDASSMWIGVLLTSALAGQAQAGIFAAVGRYVLAGLLVMNGLRIAVAPQISRLLGEQRRADALAVYRQTTMLIVLLSWPGYLLLGVFGPGFLHVFGSQFAVGAASMAVLAGAMLLNVGVGLVQTVLLMSGNSTGHLIATVIGLALNLTACAVLIPRYGALGAAIGWAIGIVVENLIAAAVAQRTLRQPLVSGALVRLAGAVAVATGLACTVGVTVAGRDLAGLGIALAVLVLGCAGLLADRRVRTLLRSARRFMEVPR